MTCHWIPNYTQCHSRMFELIAFALFNPRNTPRGSCKITLNVKATTHMDIPKEKAMSLNHISNRLKCLNGGSLQRDLYCIFYLDGKMMPFC